MKVVFASLVLLGSLFLASCGNQCPNGYNSTDPSCPGYVGYGGYGGAYGGGAYGGAYPQPQMYQPAYGGAYYPPQQPYGGGAYGNPYSYPCPPGQMYCYPVRKEE